MRSIYSAVTFSLLFSLSNAWAHVGDNTALNLVWHEASDDVFTRGFVLLAGIDIDQDGKGEILTYEQDAGQKIVYLFEASGDNNYEIVWQFQFSDGVTGLVGGERGIMVTDIDNDGFSEIIVIVDSEDPATTANGFNAGHIFEWDGTDNGLPSTPTATFDPPRDAFNQVRLEYNSTALDLDNDGKTELLLTHRGGHGTFLSIVEITSSDLSGGVTLTVEFEDKFDDTDATHFQARNIGFGITDIDLDGLSEILMFDQNTGFVRVFENTGPDAYTFVNEWQPNPAGWVAGATVNSLIPEADFDNDGVKELYLSDTKGNSWIITPGGDVATMFDDANWHLLHDWKVDNVFHPFTSIRDGIVGDVDRDNKPDIYFAGVNFASILDIEYNGGAVIGPDSYSYFVTAIDANDAFDSGHFASPVNLALSDMDNDGHLEVVAIIPWSGPNPVSNLLGLYVFEHATGTGGTPTGDNVAVQPLDSETGTSPVSLTFSEVTSSGETTLTTSSGGQPPPAGFGLGSPAVYYDISTTAGFIPPVEVCINYTGISFDGNEENLNLSHFEDTDGDGVSDTWVQLTASSQDIENNIICVSVASLSLFAIFEPLPGVIAGTVSVNAVGLANVTVELLDILSLSVDGFSPIPTGSLGDYSFTDVIPETYQVIIVEPLGYSVDANPKLAPLAPGGTTTVDFALTEVVLSNNARGMGYWKHQFNVYVNDKGKAQESPEELTLYIERIHQVYTPHFDVFGYKTTFEEWQSILTVSRKGTMLDRAKHHLAALVLNFASLKIGQYEVVTADGHTVGDVLTFVSTLITDYDVSNDELAKDLAEMVNNHQEISAGLVTAGRILYKVAGGDVDWSFVPTEYALHNNYPNPFNPVTTISYDLPVVSDVKIVIYNLMSQEVRRWDIQGQTAGNHRVSWNASSLASGVYLYRLQAADFVETKKMILMK